MTTRTTSREAYEQLVQSGQLVAKQAKIMDVLTARGDATSGEVLQALKVRNVNAWRARFTELQARGLIVEAGTRKCAVSGRRCVVWHATDRTKPMDVKRGARSKNGAAEWKEIARRLATAIEDTMRSDFTTWSDAMADYRKLARTRV